MKRKTKYQKPIRILIVLLLLVTVSWAYIGIANRNSKHMTGRQKFLKAVYPVFTGFKNLFGKSVAVLTNEKNVQPSESFYHMAIHLNDGAELRFEQLKGKKVLLVNTASNCGYTAQYELLEQLSKRFADKLVIIGFPANDFSEQEKGSDEEIALFCKENYGVSFPLAKKASVVKGPDQQEVFQWLTDKKRNGWNGKQPTWNFSKYLVSEDGVLLKYFDPAISPLSETIIKLIGP